MHRRSLETLPDGAFIVLDDKPYALRANRLLRWTPSGYTNSRPRTRGRVDVLTPPSILAVLKAGYLPGWHPSAK